MNQAYIRQIIKHTCACCGVPELAKGIVIVSFNFTNDIIADAEYICEEISIIRISPTAWAQLNIYTRYELIIHEVCHIVTDYHDRKQEYNFHGREWKLFMKCAGIYKPKALIYY